MKVRENFMPVYYQLAEDLQRQIETGVLKPGQMVPSESQLCIDYGISRTTVRRGLALLLESGLIETIRGIGNFVAKPKMNQATLTFEETANVKDIEVKDKLLEVKRIKAVGEIAARFNIAEGKKVFMIRRLIYGENDPIGIDVKYIPYLKGKPLLEKEIEYADFPEIVATHSDVMLHKIERTISACPLMPEEAELLKTDAGHPALCVIQVIYSKEEQPLGFSKTVYRGETFELKTVSFPYSGKM